MEAVCLMAGMACSSTRSASGSEAGASGSPLTGRAAAAARCGEVRVKSGC